MKKSGQITIFAIAAIVIVSAVILFFFFRENIGTTLTQKAEENPESFLSSCVDKKIREAIKNISLHGGYIKNELHKEFKFKDENPINISYLCYNQNNYFPCINQKPLLIEDFKNEVKKYTKDEFERCFDELGSSFENKAYKVEMDYNGFDVNLMPERIIFQTDSRITLTKSGESSIYTDLKITKLTKTYELLGIVQEVLNQESEFCHFEKLGFNLLYSDFSIEKINSGDDLIYTLESYETKERFRFALKGCTIPPGI